MKVGGKSIFVRVFVRLGCEGWWQIYFCENFVRLGSEGWSIFVGLANLCEDFVRLG